MFGIGCVGSLARAHHFIYQGQRRPVRRRLVEPFGIGALWHAVKSLNGFVTFDSYPMHVTSLPLIII